MYVHNKHASAHRGQKQSMDSLEMELQAVAVGAGNQTQFS